MNTTDYRTLAVRYRPTNFSDVVEQGITTTILAKQIEKKTIKNAYLFSGASGCGKTSAARIFANMINNGIGTPIEVDAASNNGVDNVRTLVELANQRALVGEYKVIVIDECHSLTSQAWQAFLKGLEECPKYTVFIFCTTAPEKIPQTILNRLQRFNFNPISTSGIKARLEYICEQEGFTNYHETCDFISKISNNSMRDAITNLEQVADLSTNLSLEAAKQLFTGLSYETMFKLTWAIQNKKEDEIISIIESLFNTGQNLKHFIDVYLGFILDLAKYTIFKNIEITNIPKYLAAPDNAVVQFTTDGENKLEYFNNLAEKLLEVKFAIKNDLNYKDTILVLLIKLIRA